MERTNTLELTGLQPSREDASMSPFLLPCKARRRPHPRPVSAEVWQRATPQCQKSKARSPPWGPHELSLLNPRQTRGAENHKRRKSPGESIKEAVPERATSKYRENVTQ